MESAVSYGGFDSLAGAPTLVYTSAATLFALEARQHIPVAATPIYHTGVG